MSDLYIDHIDRFVNSAILFRKRTPILADIPAPTSKRWDFWVHMTLSIQTRRSYTDIFDGLFSEIARGLNWYEVEDC